MVAEKQVDEEKKAHKGPPIWMSSDIINNIIHDYN